MVSSSAGLSDDHFMSTLSIGHLTEACSDLLGSSLIDTLSLALPRSCVGCRGERGPLCPRCWGTVVPLGPAGAERARPDPVPLGMPATWATAQLEGGLRVALTAYKDNARRDLVSPLSTLLAQAISAARLHPEDPVVLVPIPGSARSQRVRGDRPLEALTLAAAATLPGEVRVVRALRSVRVVRDQSGLDHRQRRTNLEGSMALVPGGREWIAGQAVILVDDIVTTGATLVEGARALVHGGLSPRAACIAATRRRRSARPMVVGGSDAD